MGNKAYTLDTESLLRPLPPQKSADRRAWSIPLNTVWVPYFTAMKVAGKVDIADETLGAPIRLAREKDGTPRFSEKGTPMTKVAKELSDCVRLVRENFVAILARDAARVQKGDPEGYKAQLQRSQKAGTPVLQADADAVMRYLAAVKAAQDAAQAPAPEAVPAAA